LRFLYSVVLYLVLPWVLLRLWMRGARMPAYRRNWKERLGLVPVKREAGKRLVWVHAVSVGEVRAAESLVRGLLAGTPDVSVLITTITPSGRETVRRLFDDDVSCHYLPYDLASAVKRFLDNARPDIAVIMETEIWPNLYYQLDQRNIPLLLLNARLSEASMRAYRKLRGLVVPALRRVVRIAAQSEADARRFVRLGAVHEQVEASGNLKLDAQLPQDFRERCASLQRRLGFRSRIWVAGSTHSGEEERVLKAQARVLEQYPDALLLLVPRHPDRAAEVAGLCQQAGLLAALYSETSSLNSNVQVVIVDVLGELVYLYGVAAAAFVGGSLVEKGGHNPVEPALAGVPVVSGPHVGNFTAIFDELRRAGGVRIIESESALADAVRECFDSRNGCKLACEAALRTVEKNRGALQRARSLVYQYLV
jgi:3-deoxy-D-manno-octulosonic-acid transferase